MTMRRLVCCFGILFLWLSVRFRLFEICVTLSAGDLWVVIWVVVPGTIYKNKIYKNVFLFLTINLFLFQDNNPMYVCQVF